MNVLPSSDTGSVGAVALLGYADNVELGCFNSLEDSIWTLTTLSPSVVEAVRLRCAQIRRCHSCSSVRFSAATADGLTESQIALLDSASDCEGFSEAQRAALDLVHCFLLDPCMPAEGDRQRMGTALGTAGVMEVLLSCAVFSSSELRLALGQDSRPEQNVVVARESLGSRDRSSISDWPTLGRSILDPEVQFPEVDDGFACLVRGRIATLRAQPDLSDELVAACIVRSLQLHRVGLEDPVAGFLVPTDVVLPDAAHVSNWTSWPAGIDRYVLMLAEQLWMDPSKVGHDIVEPLSEEIGVAGVIRATWSLIWLGQLHRLALVLHRHR